MNSLKPYPEDELDSLVRGALQARVSGQEPPDRVWEQIKLKLERDQPAPQPRRFRVGWSPLALQAALTLLLVMLGWVGLQTLLNPDGIRNSSHNKLPPVATVRVEERSASSNTAFIAEERDLYLLKTEYRRITRSDAEPEDDSSKTSPPERRSIESQSFPPLHPVEERKLR